MIIKIAFFSVFFILFQLESLAQNITKDKDFPTNVEINALLKKTPKDSRRLPMSFNLDASGTIKKLTNIGSVEKLNIDNNGGVIYQNIVFLTLDNKTFFAPEKSELYGREYFIKMFDLQTRIIEKLDTLNLKLGKNSVFDSKLDIWEKRLNSYAKKLTTIPNNDPRRKEGFEILKNYKTNIDISKKLYNDFSSEVKLIQDNKGNKSYLFNIENLKNNPRYSFIGEEFHGFSLVKKFNKYGYVSQTNDVKKIPFKYDFGTPFFDGFAYVFDKNKRCILNTKGKEILTFYTSDVDDIIVLPKGNFIIKKYANPNENKSYIINSKGKILTGKFNNINIYSKNIFIATKWNVMKKNGAIPLECKQFNNKFYCPKDRLITINGYDLYSSISGKELNSCIKVKKKNPIVISDVLGVTEDLFIFSFDIFKNNKKQNILILKNINKKKILSCKENTNLGFDYILLNEYDNSPSNYYLGYRHIIDNLFTNKDIISVGTDSLHLVNLRVDRLHIKQGIFDFQNNKSVGDNFDGIAILKLDSDINGKTLFLINNSVFYKDKIMRGLGLVNRNGLEIVPPIFENISLTNEKELLCISHNNKTFKIDLKGNCIDNCNEYNSLLKEYYKLKSPMLFKDR